MFSSLSIYFSWNEEIRLRHFEPDLLRPVLYRQPNYALELAVVVRCQRDTESHRVGSDPEVIVSDEAALPRLQRHRPFPASPARRRVLTNQLSLPKTMSA